MLNFPFPPIVEQGINPIWQNGQFLIGELVSPVLDYLADKNNFGWNDELTAFHENEAGANHIIDQVSRANALVQLKKHIKKPNPVILEVGCSSGFMLQDIQAAYPAAQLMGADIVKEPLIQLSEKIKNIPLIRFDLTECPLPSASVDAVVILNVLEHIEDDNKALQQIQRILKPGGVLIIEVPANPNLYDIYDKMLLHFRRYTRDELRRKVQAAGLTIKKFSHLACFLYPAFWLVKTKNRKQLMQMSVAQANQKVSQHIRKTKNNFLMNWIMRCEAYLGKWLTYPFGIRCTVVCIK